MGKGLLGGGAIGFLVGEQIANEILSSVRDGIPYGIVKVYFSDQNCLEGLTIVVSLKGSVTGEEAVGNNSTGRNETLAYCLA